MTGIYSEAQFIETTIALSLTTRAAWLCPLFSPCYSEQAPRSALRLGFRGEHYVEVLW